MHKPAALIIISILALSGCASAIKKVQRVEAKVVQPIDCEKAEMDIMYLTEALSDTQEQLANGVATILPTTAIFSLIAGEYSSRQTIATGELNNTLNKKIMEISEHCQIDHNMS